MEQDKKIWHQEKMIGRQGKTLGDERAESEKRSKELESQIDEFKKHKSMTDEEYNELALEDPAKALKLREKDKEIESDKKELEKERTQIVNKSLINDNIPDFENEIDGIAGILKTEADQSLSESFKKDPYSLHPALVINLAKRSAQAREISELKNRIEKYEI